MFLDYNNFISRTYSTNFALPMPHLHSSFLYYFCHIYCSCLICCLCFTCFSCYLRNTYLVSRLCIVRCIYRLRRAYRLAFARYPCICVSLLLSLSLVAHMLIRPFPITTIASSEFYGSMLSYRVYSVLRTGCCG